MKLKIKFAMFFTLHKKSLKANLKVWTNVKTLDWETIKTISSIVKLLILLSIIK